MQKSDEVNSIVILGKSFGINKTKQSLSNNVSRWKRVMMFYKILEKVKDLGLLRIC